jgi:hypothetical protein
MRDEAVLERGIFMSIFLVYKAAGIVFSADFLYPLVLNSN